MKGLLKITFLIGALALTACSKSVNGDDAGGAGNPTPFPVGNTPVIWDNTVQTKEMLVLFSNQFTSVASKFNQIASKKISDPLFKSGFSAGSPVIYKNGQGIEYILIRLETVISKVCNNTDPNSCVTSSTRGDGNTESIIDDLSGNFIVKGSAGGSCLYIKDNEGNLSLSGSNECSLALKVSDMSIEIETMPPETTFRFYIEYQSKN